MENREEVILNINELYKSAQVALNNGQLEFAAIQCRKILEALLLLFKIAKINQYALPQEKTYRFFRQMGTKAAHFGEQFTNEEKDSFINNLPEFKILIDETIDKTKPSFIEELTLSTSNKKLKNCLKYFKASHFQCIKKIEIKLPVDAQFIVFTGENGDGKTSILQAIAIGIKGNYDRQSGQIWCDNENFNVEVEFRNGENIPAYNQISLANSLEIPIFDNFSAYSASRLILQSVESMEDNNNKRSATFNLFRNEGTLLNIEHWFKELIFLKKDKKFEQAKRLLIELLPHVDDIVLNGSKFEYLEKGLLIPLEHLSSGHKSIIAMIGDMLMRLSEAQPDIDDPKEFAGIVLIDELEAHLHPKWQKEFPHLLSQTFPKVQFIVTTHSAITLLGMPKNTVFFKVKRTEEEGTQIERLEIDVENLLPNQILTSPLFDLDNIKSTENTNVNNIRLEDNFQEIIKRDEVRNDLAKILKEKYKKTV